MAATRSYVCRAARGIENLELLVVCDPYPTTWSVLSERKNGTYVLPACTSFEMDGSRTASNRALQWGEQIVKPIFECKNDYDVMYMLARKLGFAEQMFKNIKVENGAVSAEDILREINRGGWSTGYCGQSPERLKAHMRNQSKFDVVTLRAPKDDPEVGGDYYGLPWPCWGTPEFKHPGTPVLYNTDLPVKEGGGTFRPRFGVERNGVSLLADGSYARDSEIKDAVEFTLGAQEAGWDKDLTVHEMAIIERVNPANPDAVSWSIDLSGGISVSRSSMAAPLWQRQPRSVAWNLPIYSSPPRTHLHAAPRSLANTRRYRTPAVPHAQSGFTIQKTAVDKGTVKQFPLILTSGRLVEYEGGGERRVPTNGWRSSGRKCLSRSTCRRRRARHQGQAGSGSYFRQFQSG
jgi:formate dehydrogenase major subunit